MSYIKDPTILSLLWGRIGAAVLALAAFGLGLLGYSLTAEDQAGLSGIITTALTGVAGLLAIISKVRESKKAKE